MYYENSKEPRTAPYVTPDKTEAQSDFLYVALCSFILTYYFLVCSFSLLIPPVKYF